MIQTKRSKIRYKDFKPNLDIHPVSGDLVMNENDASVKRRLKNLMFTDKYERAHNPRLGAGLKDQMFENVTQFTADNIKDAITFNINNNEPSVILHLVEVRVAPDDNGYQAKIVFSIDNNAEHITIEQLIQRIR